MHRVAPKANAYNANYNAIITVLFSLEQNGLLEQ